MTMEAVSKLADVQANLLMSYAGADFEMFRSIAPICAVCNNLAIGPLNCALCPEAVLCSPCFDKGSRTCGPCEEKPQGKR